MKQWDDANDGRVKLTGLKVTVPRTELQKYLGREVECATGLPTSLAMTCTRSRR